MRRWSTVSEPVGWLLFRLRQSVRQYERGRPHGELRIRSACRWGSAIICSCWTGPVAKFARASVVRCRRIFSLCSSDRGISSEMWVDCGVNFRKWFRSSVGPPENDGGRRSSQRPQPSHQYHLRPPRFHRHLIGLENEPVLSNFAQSQANRRLAPLCLFARCAPSTCRSVC